MEKYYVYLHLNKINGKKYYGITSEDNPEKRWKKGYYHNNHFQNAINKYGWENFEHIIIAENLSKKEAELKEQELILRNKTNNQAFGYNLTSGGEGVSGYKFSEESRKKMSEARKGEKHWNYGNYNENNANIILQFDLDFNFNVWKTSFRRNQRKN